MCADFLQIYKDLHKNNSNSSCSVCDNYIPCSFQHNNWVVGFRDWSLILDVQGGPNHKGQDECEGAQKCGSDAMLLADIDK